MRGPGLVALWQALKQNRKIRTVNVQRQSMLLPATDEDIATVKRAARGVLAPVLECVRLCSDWEEGHCKRGKECSLAHQRAALVSVIEVRPDKAAIQLEEGPSHRGRLLILGQAEGKKHGGTKPQRGAKKSGGQRRGR